jgi:hypothetical protein
MDGRQLGAEIHFVHSLISDVEGIPLDQRNLLVFGVLLDEDATATERNPLLPAELVDVIVTRREESKIYPIKTSEINPLGKLRSVKNQNTQQEIRLPKLLHYQGSLTTPQDEGSQVERKSRSGLLVGDPGCSWELLC